MTRNIGEGGFLYVFTVGGELSGVVYFTMGLLSIDLPDGREETNNEDI